MTHMAFVLLSTKKLYWKIISLWNKWCRLTILSSYFIDILLSNFPVKKNKKLNCKVETKTGVIFLISI